MLRPRFWRVSAVCLCIRRAFTSNASRIVDGDRVLLRTRDASKIPIFTKPLSIGEVTHTRWGDVEHSSLIGKEARDVVRTQRNHELRVLLPTLDEYVTLTPRLVTPVYPADATRIVSLLDIHVSPPLESDEPNPPIEILEAGTGHGALTLYLSRAIHAANPPLSSRLRSQLREAGREALVTRTQQPQRNNPSLIGAVKALFQLKPGFRSAPLPSPESIAEWKSRRRAIIHTLDVSPHHTARARSVIHGFRSSIYAGNVNFYTADVSDWLSDRTRANGFSSSPHPFLSHAILDLPSPERHFQLLSQTLHTNGLLLVFCPSISQLQACVTVVRKLKLPLLLERVLELGAGWTGGREWDVRLVKVKGNRRGNSRVGGYEGDETDSSGDDVAADAETLDSARFGNGDADDQSLPVTLASSSATSPSLSAHEASKPLDNGPDAESMRIQGEEGLQWVCRPKVGGRVVGGGFLGAWRRMKVLGDQHNP